LHSRYFSFLPKIFIAVNTHGIIKLPSASPIFRKNILHSRIWLSRLPFQSLANEKCHHLPIYLWLCLILFNLTTWRLIFTAWSQRTTFKMDAITFKSFKQLMQGYQNTHYFVQSYTVSFESKLKTSLPWHYISWHSVTTNELLLTLGSNPKGLKCVQS
jgi:hypothetical protein